VLSHVDQLRLGWLAICCCYKCSATTGGRRTVTVRLLLPPPSLAIFGFELPWLLLLVPPPRALPRLGPGAAAVLVTVRLLYAAATTCAALRREREEGEDAGWLDAPKLVLLLMLRAPAAATASVPARVWLVACGCLYALHRALWVI